MSRVGRKPIPVPQGAKIEIRDGAFHVEGPKGKVVQPIDAGFPVEVKDGAVHVSRSGDSGPERAKHGLYRALLANALAGVTTGWARGLDIVGVGYRAEIKGQEVHFALGYSHPVIFPVPEGIKVDYDAKTNHLNVSGADRQKVGQVAAEIRALRSPDPYKGKGVRYSNEQIRRKAGKAGKAGKGR